MKKTVKRGAFSATLTQLATGAQAGSWRITYRNSAGKVVVGGTLTTEAKARKRADDILDAMLTSTVRDLTEDESRLIHRLRSAGIPVSALTPAIDELAATSRVNACDAVNLFMTREIYGAHYSIEQRRDYKRVLKDLKMRFEDDDLSGVTSERLQKWADGWGCGEKRWNNKRTILLVFFRWCVSRGYLVKNPAEKLPRKRLPRKPEHEVWTPKEYAKILVNCPDSFIPWAVFAGMAGMRGAEIYGRPDDRKSGLRWEEIDWVRKVIVLPIRAAKQTSATKTRLIPLTPAMEDWLAPWRNATGCVHPPTLKTPSQVPNAITTQLGALVGGWKSNALRASRASYRLAEIGCVATVTLEMGHSATMLTSVYLNPRFKDDAATWFSLDRATARLLAEDAAEVPFHRAG